jgi:hypothetical protein
MDYINLLDQQIRASFYFDSTSHQIATQLHRYQSLTLYFNHSRTIITMVAQRNQCIPKNSAVDIDDSFGRFTVTKSEDLPKPVDQNRGGAGGGWSFCVIMKDESEHGGLVNENAGGAGGGWSFCVIM